MAADHGIQRSPSSSILHLLSSILVFLAPATAFAEPPERLRLIVETDAGGDPDDEQSMVRFLLYAAEWDVEGIIATRPVAREKENLNPVRDGLGIVRRQLDAYGDVHPNLVRHDRRFPTKEALWRVTVPGYDDTDDGVGLILAAVDAPDPRPVWFMNWGTDKGSAESSLKRALDRVLKERGPDGYAAFKRKLRLSSADKFGDHTWKVDPPFAFFASPFFPDMDGGRWYHRFSALTRGAGGFDVKRDVLENHGPLGATYPTNTGLRQKEGDSPTFLALIPNGLNEPGRPVWGSWAGRLAPMTNAAGRAYFEPNVRDTIDGKAHRDHTLARWAAHLQNDFRARMDWCVADDYEKANHPPGVKVAGERSRAARAGEALELDASASTDPDGHAVKVEWVFYPEAGGYAGEAPVMTDGGRGRVRVNVPAASEGKSLHFIAVVTDEGEPRLTRYGRVVVNVAP